MIAMDGENIENAGAFFDDSPSLDIKKASYRGLLL